MRSQARNLIADGAVKTKVKSSEFRFKPVKGWLGGEYTEKLGGWKARVFEVFHSRMRSNIDSTREMTGNEAEFCGTAFQRGHATYQYASCRDTHRQPQECLSVRSCCTGDRQAQVSDHRENADDVAGRRNIRTLFNGGRGAGQSHGGARHFLAVQVTVHKAAIWVQMVLTGTAIEGADNFF